MNLIHLYSHHGICQGLLQKYKDKFQAEEFLEGSEAALENFQETLYSLDKEVLSGIQDDLIKLQQEDKSQIKNSNASVDGDNASQDKINGGVNELLKRVQMSQEKIDQLNAVLATHSDWKAKAEEDSDSLYGQLCMMVSEQLLEACKNQFMESVKHSFLLKVPRMDYELGSGTIQNVSFSSTDFFSCKFFLRGVFASCIFAKMCSDLLFVHITRLPF